jgi:hypothetical protein
MPLGTLQNTNKRKCGDGDASVGGLVVFRLDLFMALTDVLKIVGGARKAMTIPEREAIAENTVRRIASKPGNPWRLNEELPPPGPAIGHGSPEWSKGRG